jgi:hypothetical protein
LGYQIAPDLPLHWSADSPGRITKATTFSSKPFIRVAREPKSAAAWNHLARDLLRSRRDDWCRHDASSRLSRRIFRTNLAVAAQRADRISEIGQLVRASHGNGRFLRQRPDPLLGAEFSSKTSQILCAKALSGTRSFASASKIVGPGS